MSQDHAWDRSLAAVASGSSLPYGYTVTLWSSGAVLSHAHGPPDIARVALFIAGALAGYGLFGAVARHRAADAGAQPDDRARIVAGTLNWLAVAGAVGTAWLASQLPASAAWTVGSAAATVVYLTVATVQLAVAAGRSAEGK